MPLSKTWLKNPADLTKPRNFQPKISAKTTAKTPQILYQILSKDLSQEQPQILAEISPIEKLSFKGLEFFVKRDDLLGDINGNKARKLAFYMSEKYPKNQHFISFGGTQSNALGALSIFCKQRGFKLSFVCPKISSFLKQNPSSNFALALKNETKIIENTTTLSLKDFALSLAQKNDIFINQGIANENAELGFVILAKELELQAKNLGLEFDIFLPSGTGVSAAFLAKNTKFRVFTTPCVGDIDYLKAQIRELLPSFNFSNLHFLNTAQKYHFAKPYPEFLTLYKELLNECGVEFDLLYDMSGFTCLLTNLEHFKRPILYLHQGGLLGNESMLERYKFKGILS